MLKQWYLRLSFCHYFPIFIMEIMMFCRIHLLSLKCSRAWPKGETTASLKCMYFSLRLFLHNAKRRQWLFFVGQLSLAAAVLKTVVLQFQPQAAHNEILCTAGLWDCWTETNSTRSACQPNGGADLSNFNYSGHTPFSTLRPQHFVKALTLHLGSCRWCRFWAENEFF